MEGLFGGADCHDRVLDGLGPPEQPSAVPTQNNYSSFHAQTSSYYSAPTTSYVTAYSDLKDYSLHGMNHLRLPAISTALTSNRNNELISSSSSLKEHPAAVQADQMNAYMEFFVDPNHQHSEIHDVVEPGGGGNGNVPSNETLHTLRSGSGSQESRLMLSSTSTEEAPQRMRFGNLQQNETRAPLKKNEIKKPPPVRSSLEQSLSPTSSIVRTPEQRKRRAEAARSRYQRMSESERREYNFVRRMRSMGVSVTNGVIDKERAAEQLKIANAKKAEAARLRYHRMSPEDKRIYNQRRTEAFRRRKMDEEALMQTPAGRISGDALAKAQQIMIRNAKKAEAARNRYQALSPDGKRDYNAKRAAAKRSKSLGLRAQSTCSDLSYGMSESELEQQQMERTMNMEDQPGTSQAAMERVEQPQVEISIPGQPAVSGDLHIGNDIFYRMEQDVERRTKHALSVLSSRHIEDDYHTIDITGEEMTVMNHGQVDQKAVSTDIFTPGPAIATPSQSMQEMVDEKQLRAMMTTGRDVNGVPVELRSLDGVPIRNEMDLSNCAANQEIVIHTLDPLNLPPDHPAYTGRTPMFDLPPEDLLSERTASDGGRNILNNQLMSTRRRRAERARQRYHSMPSEIKAQQNAKRAEMLRKSRRRDEELVQMAEQCPELSEETRRAVEDARARRARRAEQARAKYHRMNSEERRQYNAMRDAQRRQRKRAQDERARGVMGGANLGPSSHHSISQERSLDDTQQQAVDDGQILYPYDLYDEPMNNWGDQ